MADLGDRVSHLGVGLDVPQLVVVHDPQLAFVDGLGDRLGHFGFGLHQFGPILFDCGDVFLFSGDRQRPAPFGRGPGDADVGLGLVGLQAGADVLADVDVGNVDRDDLKRRLRVELRSSTFWRSGRYSKT